MKVDKINSNLDFSNIFQIISARIGNVDASLKVYLESVLTQDNKGLIIYYVPDSSIEVWDGVIFKKQSISQEELSDIQSDYEIFSLFVQ